MIGTTIVLVTLAYYINRCVSSRYAEARCLI